MRGGPEGKQWYDDCSRNGGNGKEGGACSDKGIGSQKRRGGISNHVKTGMIQPKSQDRKQVG